MGILTVAVILTVFGFSISLMMRGKISVLLRIFCFATLLTITGLFIIPMFLSMGISGGDVVGVIGNSLESARTGFSKLSSVSFFDAIDEISGFIVIVLGLSLIVIVVVVLKRRK